MISRYEVALNGISLSSLHKDILILDIAYSPAVPKDDMFTVANRHGSRVYERYFDKSQVTVTFEIHAYDTSERQKICAQIVNWAKNGGTLQTSDRDGQFLQCVCSAFPAVTSAKKWTDSLSIVFMAYTVPFWQNVIPERLELSGTLSGAYWYVPGNIAQSAVEVEIYPTDTLVYASLAIDDKIMGFNNLSITSGHSLHITYDNNMIQSIKDDAGTSLLHTRSGVDDLLAPCGAKSYVSFSTNVSSNLVFKTKGLWL